MRKESVFLHEFYNTPSPDDRMAVERWTFLNFAHRVCCRSSGEKTIVRDENAIEFDLDKCTCAESFL